MRLQGKVAVITGGTKGIGRAMALALAAEGARLVLSYARRAAAAAETVLEIERAGGQAIAVVADAAEEASAHLLAQTAMEHFGRLDIWINNAGADILTGPARELPAVEKLQRLVAVDLFGTFHGSRVAGEFMASGAGGSIINIAWDHVLQGYPTPYGVLFGAAKGGVLGMSTSLARQLAPRVRVNVLAPGWIKTAWGNTGAGAGLEAKIAGMTPLARWGLPSDMAAAAIFLASDESSFITGQVLAVNGGVTMG